MSSTIQSLGECHRTKSSKTDPGLAALKDAISDSRTWACILEALSLPPGASCRAVNVEHWWARVSAVYRGAGYAPQKGALTHFLK